MAWGQINRGLKDITTQVAGMAQDNRSGFDVNYENVGVPDYWQNMATEGYGQSGMRDMVYGQAQQAQSQFLGQRGQLRGAMGGRGMYDSSVRQQGEAGLIGEREARIGMAESNVWKENQKVMMEGQRVLEDIRKFNVQNQFTADITNQQTGLQLYMQDRDLDMQQRQLEEQKRQAKWNMAGGLLGLATSFVPGL